MKNAPESVPLTQEEIDELKKRIRESNLDDETKEQLVAFIDSLAWISSKLEKNALTIRKLQKIFGVKTEKIESGKAAKEGAGDIKGGAENPNKDKPPKKKGHGKNGQNAHPGATVELHPLMDMSPDDICSACGSKALYKLPPGSVLTFKGHAPIEAIKHVYERLRCATCGEVFYPPEIDALRLNRYDDSCIVLIALLKYGSSFPFYRLMRFQKILKSPLPASTQWDLVERMGNALFPVYSYLSGYCANAELVSIDDTGNRIIRHDVSKEQSHRKGINTTGMVFKIDGRQVTLYFTGTNHAGENLKKLLTARDEDLAPIIQMSDALSRNFSKEIVSTVCSCLIHARRNFFDLVKRHELENPKTYLERKCRQVILIIARIYFFESIIQEQNLSDEERLSYHQRRSSLLMKVLLGWAKNSMLTKKVEPNSNLGSANQYLINHEEKLCQFLKTAGAPLDTNVVERALKFIILNRKNSIFYKTDLGAIIGDIHTSLIKSCVDVGESPKDYFDAVLKNKSAVHKNPELWLPWNFREQLVKTHSVPADTT